MAGAAALALVLVPAFVSLTTDDYSFGSVAWANDDGDGGQGKMQKGGGSEGKGKRPPDLGGKGKGQGGPDATSEGKGPGANRPEGGGGGKPAWAQEGIPEVELGRLNVARAPSHVIDRAVLEILNNFTPAMESLYEMTAEAAAALLASDYDNVVRIDSPLENLGLYRDLVSTGTTALPGVTPASVLDLAAILLGSASDKVVPITDVTVSAINTILGLSMSEADVATVAAAAEAIRAAILVGHGE
jgi:hypothetical protein